MSRIFPGQIWLPDFSTSGSGEWMIGPFPFQKLQMRFHSSSKFPFALVVTVNLASMATRYTIPFLFLGISIDAGVIVASFIIK